MSHIVNISTKITDLGALQAAVMALGFEWRANQKTYAWYGEWVGDEPMPEGVNVADLGKCEHAIRVPGCGYEVGVVRVNGGYELRYDYYQLGGLEEAIGQKAGPIVQSYAFQKTLREARQLGRTVLSTQKLSDGSYELLISGGGR